MVMTIQTLQGTGVVRIESNPSGGDVYIDGEYYGTSPITVKDVVVGRHVYIIKCQGYPEHSGSINVVAGDVCYVRYDFTNYNVEESCPPIQLSAAGHIKTLQEPTPIPGYVIVSQNTIVWMLVSALAAILFTDYIKKRI
jgi:hypothetical protein